MITEFALRLLLGMSLMWTIMPRREVTSGFFRIQMLIALGLSVLGAMANGRMAIIPVDLSVAISPTMKFATPALCIVLAVLAFMGSVLWTLERRRAGSLICFLIAIGSAAALLVGNLLGDVGDSFSGALYLLSQLSSAVLLGGAMTAMLLGHWYLTAPTMSIQPLSRLNCYYGTAGVIRLILCAIGLGTVFHEISDDTYWIWLAVRWIAGIVGPLVVAVMVWRILRYKNTQSATGVLFAGLILTFIGELTASLLFGALKTPL